METVEKVKSKPRTPEQKEARKKRDQERARAKVSLPAPAFDETTISDLRERLSAQGLTIVHSSQLEVAMQQEIEDSAREVPGYDYGVLFKDVDKLIAEVKDAVSEITVVDKGDESYDRLRDTPMAAASIEDGLAVAAFGQELVDEAKADVLQPTGELTAADRAWADEVIADLRLDKNTDNSNIPLDVVQQAAKAEALLRSAEKTAEALRKEKPREKPIRNQMWSCTGSTTAGG